MKQLDMIIPISLELDHPTVETTVSEILEQKERYGFTKFMLATPCGGWRSKCYPPHEHFEKKAAEFAEVKKALLPHGIECGWWDTLTLKSGPSAAFTRMVKANGSLSPYSSCPLDPAYKAQFATDIATFAAIAKPSFIFFEDDYTLFGGCYCERHLAEFAKRAGCRFSREELLTALAEKSEEGYRLLRLWRDLERDTLVEFAKAVREKVDLESAEIPIYLMEAGNSDIEGNFTQAVSQALAGKQHTPASRIRGCFYNGGETKSIPNLLYHPLYAKQHISGDFKFYHESDTFPHTRFFTSAAQMRVIMSSVYSMGYAGSTFQTQQLLDDPNEEHAYGDMFKAERARFNAVHNVALQCDTVGVEIDYDPFWNTVSGSTQEPEWIRCVSLFGIPYTTTEASVAFWDRTQAAYADDETVKKYLSKGLFLDGAAALELCNRGYADLLGVEIGDNVAAENNFGLDLGAREVFAEPHTAYSKGKHMPIAHMYAHGANGKLLRITVKNEACEILTNAYTFEEQYVCPAMVRFTNRLGGKIVIMGMTLKGNRSQSLFNYRRQRIMQEMLKWCDDRYVYVKDAPNVYTIMNEKKADAQDDLIGMLTLTNLGDDPINTVSLHLPKKWQTFSQCLWLNEDGAWIPANTGVEGDSISIQTELCSCQPLYLLFK